MPKNGGPDRLPPEDVTRVVARIDALIAERKLTIREVERRASLSAGTLARMRRGERRLDAARLVDIAQALGVEPDELVGAAAEAPADAAAALAAENETLRRRLRQLETELERYRRAAAEAGERVHELRVHTEQLEAGLAVSGFANVLQLLYALFRRR